ncbi:serine/threonine-protein kinase-21 [Elsinoe australis]|uniref:Serine/threonine-protein kinase-21 n=1 Tax=Elsinoe australis TaxID=40998 RepID=A0A4V6DTE4_9PEZI|nr:serine/threonine-protein kinase-21 [Elsinoe australis]
MSLRQKGRLQNSRLKFRGLSDISECLFLLAPAANETTTASTLLSGLGALETVEVIDDHGAAAGSISGYVVRVHLRSREGLIASIGIDPDARISSTTIVTANLRLDICCVGFLEDETKEEFAVILERRGNHGVHRIQTEEENEPNLFHNISERRCIERMRSLAIAGHVFQVHYPVLTPEQEKRQRQVLRAMMRIGSKDGPKSHYSQWRKLGPIGSGSFGHVWKFIDLVKGKVYAVKEISTASMPLKSHRVDNELATIRKLRHPNLISCEAWDIQESWLNKTIYLAMPFMPQNLHNILHDDEHVALLVDWRKKGTLDDVLRQICCGLRYMHENDVLHRDLKSNNVLLVQKDDAQVIPKLGDFGFSLTKQGDKFNSHGGGCPWYAAPEAAQGKDAELSFASDIFSLGVLCLEMYLPQGFNCLVKVSCRNGVEHDEWVSDLTGLMGGLDLGGLEKWVKSCVRQEPDMRPTIVGFTRMVELRCAGERITIVPPTRQTQLTITDKIPATTTDLVPSAESMTTVEDLRKEIQDMRNQASTNQAMLLAVLQTNHTYLQTIKGLGIETLPPLNMDHLKHIYKPQKSGRGRKKDQEQANAGGIRKRKSGRRETKALQGRDTNATPASPILQQCVKAIPSAWHSHLPDAVEKAGSLIIKEETSEALL